MKKLVLSLVAIAAFGLTNHAQSDYKIMAGVKAGIAGPACTNCGLVYGGGASLGYAISDRWVTSLEVANYSKNDEIFEDTYKTTVLVLALSGDFYLKEAYKGFYLSPEVAYITRGSKLNGVKSDFSESNITAGLNLGWAISFGERIEFVPHFGYSTWFENSKGRITLGTKLAFKF